MALSHVLLSMWVHPKWIDRVLSVKGRAQLSFKKQLASRRIGMRAHCVRTMRGGRGLLHVVR